MRELRKAPHAEAKEEPGLRSGKRMTAQVVAFGGCVQNARSVHAGVPRPGRLVGWRLVTFRVRRQDVLSESRMRYVASPFTW